MALPSPLPSLPSLAPHLYADDGDASTESHLTLPEASLDSLPHKSSRDMDHLGVLDLRYAKNLQFSELPKTFSESLPLDLSISKPNNNGSACEEFHSHNIRPSVITSNHLVNRNAIMQRSRWNHRSHPSIDSDSSFESEHENDLSHPGVWFTKRLSNTTDASRCSSTDSLRWRESLNSSEVTDFAHTDTENDSEAYDSSSTLSLGFYKELPELTANVSIDQNRNTNSMIIELSSCKAEIIDAEDMQSELRSSELKVQFKRKNENNETHDNYQISPTETYFEELLKMQNEDRNNAYKLTKKISAGIQETASKYIKEIRKTKADMFTSGLNLEVDGKKKQHCLKCSEEFTSVTGLLQHLMTHSSRNPGEKLIKCPVCTKRFSTIGTLEQHMLRLHTGEMKYVCKICETPYKFSTHLKKHMSTSRCGKGIKRNS